MGGRQGISIKTGKGHVPEEIQQTNPFWELVRQGPQVCKKTWTWWGCPIKVCTNKRNHQRSPTGAIRIQPHLQTENHPKSKISHYRCWTIHKGFMEKIPIDRKD